MFEKERKEAARLADEAMQGAAEARLRRLLITEACAQPFPGSHPPLRPGRTSPGPVKTVDLHRLRGDGAAEPSSDPIGSFGQSLNALLRGMPALPVEILFDASRRGVPVREVLGGLLRYLRQDLEGQLQ